MTQKLVNKNKSADAADTSKKSVKPEAAVEVKKRKLTEEPKVLPNKKPKTTENGSTVAEATKEAATNGSAEAPKKKSRKKKNKAKKPVGEQTQKNEPGKKEVEEHKLFVKNLPGDVKESEIKALSSDIMKVRLKTRGKGNKSGKKLKKIFAYLVFETREATEKNFELLKSKQIRNNQLLVDYIGSDSTYTKKTPRKAKNTENREKDLTRLHVTGFSNKAKEEDLKALFPKCTDFFMPKKRNSELNLKYAFVQFKKEKHAKEVLETTNNSVFNGQKLVVDYACVKNPDKKPTKPETVEKTE